MRKLITVIALSLSFLAATGSASINPPTCGDNCPWVKVVRPVSLNSIGGGCCCGNLVPFRMLEFERHPFK